MLSRSLDGGTDPAEGLLVRFLHWFCPVLADLLVPVTVAAEQSQYTPPPSLGWYQDLSHQFAPAGTKCLQSPVGHVGPAGPGLTRSMLKDSRGPAPLRLQRPGVVQHPGGVQRPGGVQHPGGSRALGAAPPRGNRCFVVLCSFLLLVLVPPV